MVPRILSIAAPLFIYVSLGILAFGLYAERRKFDWLSLVPAGIALIASFIFVPAQHRLFFDEDIYIHIASNLARAPVAQLTLLSGPDGIAVSSYYKEPAGWPILLSLVFLLTGASETVAFILARFVYALAVAAVYHMAREALPSRRNALIAASIFAATAISFGFSASAGADLPSALFAILAMWGLWTGNGPLAAAGLVMAAQTRLEMIVLLPLLFVPKNISWRWKIGGLALATAEVLHVLWVLSVTPVLAEAERVETAFSFKYVPGNLRDNLLYLFNPMVFPALVTGLSIFGIYRLWRSRPGQAQLVLLQAAGLFSVYLLFYAGSFNINPRYSIQFVAILAVMAVWSLRWPVLLLTMVIPYFQPMESSDYVRTLTEDHRTAVEFASKLGAADIVLTAEPEIFFNHGINAMNAVYASEQPGRLAEQFGKFKKVWYYAGARTGVTGGQQWVADRWVKSNYELHSIDSREIRGLRIAIYEMLLKPVQSDARE